MFNANFLLQGAGFIKNNQAMCKDSASSLAEVQGVYPNVATQLKAMAIASSGNSSNTGLSQAGWAPLAEVIGMCSPTSTKLYDNTSANKALVMDNFLHTGQYASTRKDKKGGGRADYSAKAVQEQALEGVKSQNANARILQDDLRFIAKPLSLAESLELVRAKLAEKATPPEVKPAARRARK